MRRLLALALAVTACGGGATPAPRHVETLSGQDMAKSPPVTLRGDYEMQWSLPAPQNTPCLMSVYLEHADGSGRDLLVNQIIETPAPAKGSTRVYALDEDRYFVNADETCGAWVVQLRPA